MTRLGTSEETGMNETPPWSAPGPWPRRRCVLTLALGVVVLPVAGVVGAQPDDPRRARLQANDRFVFARSEEHTSELQSQSNLVCRLLLEKKKKKKRQQHSPNKT